MTKTPLDAGHRPCVGRIARPAQGRWRILFAAALMLCGVQGSSLAGDAVGGGWLQGGAWGDYFNNTSLSGSPSFSRRDVRVDFNWGALGKPGGSPAPGFSALGATNYSIRWVGQVMPRFSETYTFKVAATNGARLFIAAVNSTNWAALLDAWNGPGTSTASTNLTAGQTYQLKLEYNRLTGPGLCRLLWSSPSTPEEVLDTATLAGLNVATYADRLWANVMDGGRDSWSADTGATILVPRDTNGWPMTNAWNVVFEGQNPATMAGTYLLQFSGQAQVTVNVFGTANFTVGASSYGTTLPFGIGYNAASNLTTATLALGNNNAGIMYLGFSNTRRNPGDTSATGVTNVKLMRPASPGSGTSQPLGNYIDPSFKAAASRYALLRWILNFDTDINWTDRVLPAYSTHVSVGSIPYWESMVLLANEAGKDIHVCLPVRASNNYLTNVANLFRYGSDGVNPYTSDQASPVFPPLNPNLRIIFEHENEVWNFGFANWGNNLTDMLTAYTNNTPDWQIVNYDNVYNPGTGAGNQFVAAMRWHILRALRASEIFRGVFGDAAMGTRIRPIYEYQYDDANGTASSALPFIDNYFNNADGVAHVVNPQPLNYYFWGGGGAVYYGSGNASGIQNNILFTNSGFETPTVAAGAQQYRPAGAGWTFTGTAGIFRPGAGGITNVPPEGAQAAFVQGTGQISQAVYFPASGTYAMLMQVAAFYSAGTNAGNTVNFYYDNTVITPNGNSGIAPLTLNLQNAGWFPGSWGVSPMQFNNYSTFVFQVPSPGTHTLSIVGTGIPQYYPTNTPVNTNLMAFFDQLQVISADALFNGGIPGAGQANGQVASANYTAQLNSQARYAQAYGLQPVAYEGGWSLGGDFGSTAFQNWCKYNDSRAQTAQSSSLTVFAQSGSRFYVFGTYETWPDFDTANSGAYPLTAAVDAFNNSLPPDANNGIYAPSVLLPVNNKWAWNAAAGTGGISGSGGWFYWNALIPNSGTYALTVSASAVGKAVVEVDGTVCFTNTAGAIGTNYITRGLHSIKIRSLNGAMTVTNVTVSAVGAPNPPTLNSGSLPGDGQVTLTWTPAASGPAALGYVIRYGTNSGTYSAMLAAGAVTNQTVTGLTDGLTYYFVVVATNATGYSLPSNEGSATPVAPGQVQPLLAWDFLAAGGHAASDGNVATVGSTYNAYGVQPGTITRGSGSPAAALQNQQGQGAMNMNSSTSWAAANLAAAKTANSYFQFTVAPATGNQISLSSLAYVAYQQNVHATATIVVEYSTNGFATAGASVSTNSNISSGWTGATNTVSLAAITALQNTTNAITFRLWGYGFTGYEDKGLGEVPGNNPDVQIVGSVTMPLPAPGLTPGTGSYQKGQTVTITNAVGAANIRYTTDGSTPSPTLGAIYTSPITLASNVTIKALAYLANYLNSPVATATYTVTNPPSVSISLQFDGTSLQLTWSQGTLLEATNLAGPWFTNPAVSPYTVSPSGPQDFFRVRVQ